MDGETKYDESRMRDFRPSFKAVTLVVVAIWIGVAALYGLLKPISNGCLMTYMYPTYISISSTGEVSSAKYGLYLCHEGWRKIDFQEHLKKLSGVPVLFIPGNGGSYKRVMHQEIRLNFIYLIAGLFAYISSLALTPYRVFYIMGAIGVISFALSISQQLTGAPRFGRRRHSHKR